MSRPHIKFSSGIKPCFINARVKPENALINGILWISSTHFVANSTSLARSCNVTRNSVCWNLRTHGFQTKTAKPFRHFIQHIGGPRQWKLHFNPVVTRESAETDPDNIQFVSVQRGQQPDMAGRTRTSGAAAAGLVADREEDSPAIEPGGTAQRQGTEEDPFSIDHSALEVPFGRT
jgi:hypothetical protein